MIKTIIAVAIMTLVSIATLILSSCTQVNNPTTSPQPPPTVTTTQMVTVTPPAIATTQTTTVTSPPITVTITPTPSPINTPDISSIEENNSPIFFAAQKILGYTPSIGPDGSTIQSLVTQDVYSNLDLGGFYTQNDATLVRQIPGITELDSWILTFSVPTFRLPVSLNWSYLAKSNTNPTFSLTIWTFEDFKYRYLQDPVTLNTAGIASEDYISAKGFHLQYLRQQGDFVAFVQTNNADDILGWWLKFGGIKLF